MIVDNKTRDLIRQLLIPAVLNFVTSESETDWDGIDKERWEAAVCISELIAEISKLNEHIALHRADTISLNNEAERFRNDFIEAENRAIEAERKLHLIESGKYVIVPVEATPEMLIQGGIAWSEALPSAETYVDTANACYKAMIKAVNET